MPGERRLHGDLGRLAIADLSDQDDVGILAQDRPQPVGEADVGQFVDLALVDVVERVLDGVFDGHDVAGLLVELVDGRVQGGRLAAAGRPRDDHHSVRRAQHRLVLVVSAA